MLSGTEPGDAIATAVVPTDVTLLINGIYFCAFFVETGVTQPALISRITVLQQAFSASTTAAEALVQDKTAATALDSL
jgi:hypothetical protein